MNQPVQTVAGWPFKPVQFAFEPMHAALVLVDMQYWDAHPDHGLAPAIRDMGYQSGQYYFDRLRKVVIPNIERLLTACRQRHLRIIHLVTGPETMDGSDLLPRVRKRRVEMEQKYGICGIFPPGSFERAIIPELSPEPGEIVLNKNTTSAFTSTSLDQVLRMAGVETLLFTGVVTNVCVESTARDASDRGYNCMLLEDACAAYDPESHEATLRTFGRFFGRVHSTDEILTILMRFMTASDAS